VILVATTKNLEVIREATTTVPVVFVQVSDPVAQGFVASLTKPGGNLTGFSAYEFLFPAVFPARHEATAAPATSPERRNHLRTVRVVSASGTLQKNVLLQESDGE
jgi:hypothetical protein